MLVSPTPLRLNIYFITEMHFKANPKGINPSVPRSHVDFAELKISTSSNWKDNAPELGLLLEIRSNFTDEDRHPYSAFGIAIYGNLEWDEDSKLSRDQIESTAFSILHTTARETLQAATSRGPFPAIMLPTVRYTPDSVLDNPEALEAAEDRYREEKP